jgi:hypothetical protein
MTVATAIAVLLLVGVSVLIDGIAEMTEVDGGKGLAQCSSPDVSVSAVMYCSSLSPNKQLSAQGAACLHKQASHPALIHMRREVAWWQQAACSAPSPAAAPSS